MIDEFLFLATEEAIGPVLPVSTLQRRPCLVGKAPELPHGILATLHANFALPVCVRPVSWVRQAA